MGPVCGRVVWTFQYHLRETGLHERDHTDLRGDAGPTTRARPRRTPDSPPTGCSPTGSAPRCWTGGWRCRTGLPSERDLAAGLALSRTTVGAAYALLREQGWLDSRRGSGSRLRLPDGIRQRCDRRPATASAPAGSSARRSADRRRRRVRHATGRSGRRPEMIDLTTACLPAPAEPLAAAVAAAVEQLPRYTGGDGYLPFGLPVLRESIAARYTAAGVPTDRRADPDHLRRPARLHPDRRRAVGPRRPGADRMPDLSGGARRAAGRPPGAGPGRPGRPDPLLGDADSAWDIDLFSATLRQTAPRLGYLIPDFQNPTGALMDTGTREALVAAARAARTLLLVDESFRDVPFPGTAAAAAADGRLRRRRPGCCRSVRCPSRSGVGCGSAGSGPRRRWCSGWPPPGRSATCPGRCWINWWSRTAGRRRTRADGAAVAAGHRRRGAAGGAGRRTCPTGGRPGPPAGPSLWVRLPGPFATDLALLAPSAGVRIAPGPRFGPDGTMESYLRLPFTAGVDQLVTAVGRLAAIADQAAVGARSSLPGWLA